MAVRLRPPALASEAPSRIAAPSSIVRADVRARFLAHEIGQAARHFPFVGLGESAEQHVGDHEAEHVIAEKFEPLIGAGAVAGAGQRRNVGERLLEQSRILETIADARLRIRPCCGGGAWSPLPRASAALISGGRAGRLAVSDWIERFDGSQFACSPPAHLTIVNSRFQRTDHGQRHTIQACSPSRIEKKMIWARPTMFSNGT